MNKITKITLVAMLLLLALPMRHFAQTPYRQYADDGVLLDFSKIDDVYFRTCLLYNLNQDDRFILTEGEEWGQFSINSNDNSVTNFFDAFEAFYNNTYADFNLLSKLDIDNQMTNWKNCIPDTQFLSMMMDVFMHNNRPNNNHCVDSDPFCTSDVITFDAASTSQTADQLEGTTLQDGCIGSSYNPSWYHMRIQTGGQFIIHVEGHDPNNSSTNRDVDFCMWGPYTDPTSPCVAQLTTNKIVDCSFSAAYFEDIFLGYQSDQHYHGSTGTTDHGTVNYHMPEAGEYYILKLQIIHNSLVRFRSPRQQVVALVRPTAASFLVLSPTTVPIVSVKPFICPSTHKMAPPTLGAALQVFLPPNKTRTAPTAP